MKAHGWRFWRKRRPAGGGNRKKRRILSVRVILAGAASGQCAMRITGYTEVSEKRLAGARAIPEQVRTAAVFGAYPERNPELIGPKLSGFPPAPFGSARLWGGAWE
jgi:hypothetical protein